MGKPVKIINLAERLIRQAGLVPYVDIDIIETGLRPGEKLYEELLLDVNTQEKTKNNRIFVEKRETIKPILEELLYINRVFEIENVIEIKKMLAEVIEDYHFKDRQ